MITECRDRQRKQSISLTNSLISCGLTLALLVIPDS